MTDNTGRDYIRAEDDDHRIKELALPCGLLASGLPANMKQERKEIALSLRGFDVENLLTHSECKGLVALAEKNGLKPVTWEYNPDYRSCTRLVVRMPELAAEMWRRLRPHLHLEDITNARPFGFGTNESDVWRPYGINECIRFTKYQEKDKFARHRDGAFVLNDEERSVYTVMVYLNDASEYVGGETVFYSHNKDAADEAFQEVASVTGGTGRALIFQHNLWHEGKPLVGGVKHILRTDLMFVRVATGPLTSAQEYLNKDEYLRAEALYQDSIKLQKAGDPTGSTAAYLAALDIHADLEGSVRYGPEYRILPVDVLVEIFSKLSLKDLFRVWCVSRGWRALARHPSVWKRLYRQYFGWSAPQGLGAPKRVSGHKTPLKDWHTVFRTRCVAKQKFNVVFADVGSCYIKFGMLANPGEIRVEPSLVADINGHYWSAGSGLGHHACGWDSIWYCDRYNDYCFVKRDGSADVRQIQILLRWMLLEGFATMRLLPPEHPLLLARAPDFTDANCTYIGDVMRNLLGVPCVAFVDQAVCTLAALDSATGLLLSVDRDTLAVTAVVNEEVVSTLKTHVQDTLHSISVVDSALIALPIEDQFQWEQTTIGELCALTKQVLSGLVPEQRHEVTSRCFLRGFHGDLIHSRLVIALKETGIVTINDRACHMKFNPKAPNKAWSIEEIKHPLVSTDVAAGLQKLCSSVGRAQRFFASVEPPTLRFNRTIMLMVALRFPNSMEDEWKSLQGWDWFDRDYGSDHEPIEGREIKCFKNVTELDEWWHAFAPQLETAMRKGLVRACWSNTGDISSAKADLDAILAWHERKRAAVPLLVYASDKLRGANKPNLLWRQNGISYDFFASPPPHTVWKHAIESLKLRP